MEKTSANSIRVYPHWVMTSGSQHGPWKSNEFSRRCVGGLHQSCRTLSRWLALKRSSKEGGGSRSADVRLNGSRPAYGGLCIHVVDKGVRAGRRGGEASHVRCHRARDDYMNVVGGAGGRRRGAVVIVQYRCHRNSKERARGGSEQVAGFQLRCAS